MSTAAGTMEKLDLKVGERHLIALTRLDGKLVNSRFTGDQVMFTLCDGRKMFVDPYVQNVITDAGVAPGENFEIGKIESLQGNRRVVSVVARRIGAADVQATTPGSSSNVSPNRTPTPQMRQPPPVPPVAQPAMNGAGETPANIMARCYREAIAIAANAVLHAQEQNIRITPNFEDIRCMAATLCIQETGRR